MTGPGRRGVSAARPAPAIGRVTVVPWPGWERTCHGFGVLGERTGYDPSPYGRRGNGVVRWFGEGYDNIVLAAGFSKAYSSLLAFVAVPAELKRYLKVMVPSYVYGGPIPVASLATALLGLEVNRRRGDELRAQLHHLLTVLGEVDDRFGFRRPPLRPAP